MKPIYNGNSKNSGIYKIINTTNNRIYVGSAKEFKERYKSHLYSLRKGTHHNKFLQNDWNKCGESAFEFHILEVTNGSHLERLLLEESYLHQYHDDCDKCYNIQKKALQKEPIRKKQLITLEQREAIRKRMLGHSVSDETREKLREAKLGKKLSKEIRDKISKGNKGKVCKPLTEEQKEFLRNLRIGQSPWNKGRECTEQEIENMRKIFYEKCLTDEWRQKQKLSHTGKKDSLLAIENKRKASPTKKQIIAINVETREEILFDSLKLASETLNVFDIAIYKILHGKQKKTKGWTFKRPS